jgi:hypothetical protein
MSEYMRAIMTSANMPKELTKIVIEYADADLVARAEAYFTAHPSITVWCKCGPNVCGRIGIMVKAKKAYGVPHIYAAYLRRLGGEPEPYSNHLAIAEYVEWCSKASFRQLEKCAMDVVIELLTRWRATRLAD